MWTKTMQGTKATYTPVGVSGVVKVVHDPNAATSKRLIVEMKYLHKPVGETQADVDASFGL